MICQFFTPDAVAQCMFRLVGACAGQRVIDPSCGDGAFIRNAPSGCDVYACEIDPKYAGLVGARLNRGHFIAGDALTELLPLWGTFDVAIGNPPFSAQANLERRRCVLSGFDLGLGRPSQCLEVLFLELFLKLVKPRGRIAIILPDGPLSNRPFRYVREWLLCRAHVEAIVSLPRGVFTGTTAKTNILVARKLPPAPQPYREPTAFLACNDLNELRPMALSDWQRFDNRWQKAVLADATDWRPNALCSNCRAPATGWVRLGDVFRLRTGFALYGRRRELFDTPAPDRVLLLRAKNIAPEGGLRLNQNRVFISRHGEVFSEDALVRPGEILFVRVGAGCYGRAALVPDGIEAQADDWLHILTPITDVDCENLANWFNSPEGREHVSRLAKGVGTLSISKASLAELAIPAQFIRSDNLILADRQACYRIKRRQNVDLPAKKKSEPPKVKGPLLSGG
jgi:type I restriction enzyme M protein